MRKYLKNKVNWDLIDGLDYILTEYEDMGYKVRVGFQALLNNSIKFNISDWKTDKLTVRDCNSISLFKGYYIRYSLYIYLPEEDIEDEDFIDSLDNDIDVRYRREKVLFEVYRRLRSVHRVQYLRVENRGILFANNKDPNKNVDKKVLSHLTNKGCFDIMSEMESCLLFENKILKDEGDYYFGATLASNSSKTTPIFGSSDVVLSFNRKTVLDAFRNNNDLVYHFCPGNCDIFRKDGTDREEVFRNVWSRLSNKFSIFPIPMDDSDCIYFKVIYP